MDYRPPCDVLQLPSVSYLIVYWRCIARGRFVATWKNSRCENHQEINPNTTLFKTALRPRMPCLHATTSTARNRAPPSMWCVREGMLLSKRPPSAGRHGRIAGGFGVWLLWLHGAKQQHTNISQNIVYDVTAVPEA